MKKLLIFLFLFTRIAHAQDFLTATLSVMASPSKTDSVWDQLSRSEKIPLIDKDSVAFLYRGDATSVKFMGDFNGWGYDKNLKTNGTRVSGTDVWVWKTSFPRDARRIGVNATSGRTRD